MLVLCVFTKGKAQVSVELICSGGIRAMWKMLWLAPGLITNAAGWPPGRSQA